MQPPDGEPGSDPADPQATRPARSGRRHDPPAIGAAARDATRRPPARMPPAGERGCCRASTGPRSCGRRRPRR